MAGTRSLYQRTISLSPDDLNFVEAPPKQLVLECPICYSLLFNPHIVDCCGHHFCEHCIQRVKDDETPCPMCKEEMYTSMKDKGFQRIINQLIIFCPNSTGDKDSVDCANVESNADCEPTGGSKCEWSGEIGLLEGHLNVDNRIGDCQFVVVGCMHGCGHSDMRLKLSKHESMCSQRPYSCDYCGDYESTLEDVVDRHWKECSMYPIECPNKCELRYLARGLLAVHLKEDCELEVVPCPFAWTGCDTRVQRLALNKHKTDSIQEHMEKLTLSAYKNMQRMELLEGDNQTMKATIAELEDNGKRAAIEIHALESKNEKLEKAVTTLQYENDTLKHQVTKMFTESRAEQAVLARRSFSLESSIGLPPFSFIMDNAEEKFRWNTLFLSPPFYSHIGGYRLRIQVTPNGIFFGEGTHISLTVFIMKGVFDDYLKWPFRGSVTIALQDQLDNTEHKTETVTFDNGTSQKASGRVIKNDINEKGLVMYEFFDHAWLKPTSKKRKIYVKDDKLLFKVVSVTTNDHDAH